MMYINTMVALSANTPGADGSLVEWALFIFNKYSTLFLKATWVTLYVALIGTLLGFILGFAVGIINTVKIHKEDNSAAYIACDSSCICGNIQGYTYDSSGDGYLLWITSE